MFGLSIALSLALTVLCGSMAKAQIIIKNLGPFETVLEEAPTPSQQMQIKNQRLDNTKPLDRAVRSLVCHEPEFVSDGPFVISTLLKNYDEQGKSGRKLMEPLLENGKTTILGVPVFSLLRSYELIQPPKIYQKNQLDLQVGVISLPNEQALKEMGENRKLARASSVYQVADQGDQGLFDHRATHPASEFVFKVKDKRVLENFPRLKDTLSRGSIRFMQDDGRFLRRQCCLTDAAATGATATQCQNQYAFEVIPDDSPEFSIKRYFDNTEHDSLYGELFPIQSEQIRPLSQILSLIEEPEFDFIDFQYFDTRGFVKVPLDLENKFTDSAGRKVPDIQTGPLGSLHYKSDDPNANDAFGDPMSICAFLTAVKAFNKKCTGAGCQVQWGDFYHSDRWYQHADHDRGTCVDVRPVRRSEGYGPLPIFTGAGRRCANNSKGVQVCRTVQGLNPAYDRQRTQLLIDYFRKAGGVGKANEKSEVLISNVLFNDTSGVRGVTYAQGHSNHIHVCFPANHPRVKSACLDGL
jgi:hypothetical protein